MSQITTHILDTSSGTPAEKVELILYKRENDGWTKMGSGKTNADGRASDLVSKNTVLDAGIYKIHFETREYFTRQNVDTFYPSVDIVFTIEGDGQHYHVPLLIAPFGYSTYRGS
ncbi:MAG: hydroxyisourate hydrolase [Pseudomonadota bacterium]